MEITTETERQQRLAEFIALLDQAPGAKRIDRIRYCAKKLLLSEQTIRTYLMEKPRRFPKALSVQVLAAAIAKDSKHRRPACK